MGKVVAISSSPKVDGNSNTILDAVIDGAMGLSTNTIEFYRLQKIHNLRGCDACCVCKEKGICVLDDELSDVVNNIKDCDILLISTPVYFGGPSSQLKALIDRMYAFIGTDGKSRLESGKKAVIVTTCSGDISEAKRVSDLLSSVLTYLDFDVTNTIEFSDNGGTSFASNDEGLITLAKTIGRNFRYA